MSAFHLTGYAQLTRNGLVITNFRQKLDFSKCDKHYKLKFANRNICILNLLVLVIFSLLVNKFSFFSLYEKESFYIPFYI
jgi:hypothetical protein